MKNAALAALLAAMALWSAACTVDAVTIETSTSELVYVAPETVECPDQAGQQCLLIRRSPDDAWQVGPASIEGLEYVPGVAYEVIVDRQATVRATISNQGILSFPEGENRVTMSLIGVMGKQVITPSASSEVAAADVLTETETVSASEPVTTSEAVTTGESSAEEVAPAVEVPADSITAEVTTTVTATDTAATSSTATESMTETATVEVTESVTETESAAEGVAETEPVTETGGLTQSESMSQTEPLTETGELSETEATTGTADADAPSRLTESLWMLLSYGPLDDRRVPDGATDVTIEFVEESETGGSVSGESGCNRYGGTYEVNGAEITITLGRVTRMLCASPGGSMQLESTILNALLAAEFYTLAGDRLTIYYQGEQAALIFVAIEE